MFVDVNGCHMYYEIYGNLQADQAIIFIHGGPGLGDCRADIASFWNFSDSYKLVFFDMRGCGRSADIPPYTHEQWVYDLEVLRKKLGLTKIILHGSSYGGFIAQEYALYFPHYVKKLILNVTAPDHDHHSLAIENAMKSDEISITKEELMRLFDGRVISNEDFRNLYTKILPLYTMKQDKKAIQNKIDHLYFHYQTHNEAFHKNLKQFDLKKQLPKLKMPILVITGEYDWIIPPDHSKRIAEQVSHAIYVLFKHYGHSLIREQEAIYQKILRKFLRDEINEHKIIVDVF